VLIDKFEVLRIDLETVCEKLGDAPADPIRIGRAAADKEILLVETASSQGD